MIFLPNTSGRTRLWLVLSSLITFYNRLVSLDTAEAILNQLAPEACLPNDIINKTGTIYMLEDALKHHNVLVQKGPVCGGFRPKGKPHFYFYAICVFSSIDVTPDDKVVCDLCNKGEELLSQISMVWSFQRPPMSNTAWISYVLW